MQDRNPMKQFDKKPEEIIIKESESDYNLGGFHILPAEIIMLIASFLKFKEMYNFARSNRVIKNIVYDTPIQYVSMTNEAEKNIKSNTYSKISTLLNKAIKIENSLGRIQSCNSNSLFNKYRNPQHNASLAYVVLSWFNLIVCIIGFTMPSTQASIGRYIGISGAIGFCFTLFKQIKADLNVDEENKLRKEFLKLPKYNLIIN